MSPAQAYAFLAFAVVAAVTPGPSNVILTTTGANVGIWRGIPCLLGVAGGMGLMIALVALGLGSLVVGNAALLGALNWAGPPSCSGCPGKSPAPVPARRPRRRVRSASWRRRCSSGSIPSRGSSAPARPAPISSPAARFGNPCSSAACSSPQLLRPPNP